MIGFGFSGHSPWYGLNEYDRSEGSFVPKVNEIDNKERFSGVLCQNKIYWMNL
jgi:hypothetical protein